MPPPTPAPPELDCPPEPDVDASDPLVLVLEFAPPQALRHTAVTAASQ
jgi:hypothetical protein